MFRAAVVDQTQQGTAADLRTLQPEFLTDGDTLVEVLYSSLNYKDALLLTGTAPIAKKFPLIAGIDLVGQVVKSVDPDRVKDQLVLATGYGLGEKYHGGLTQLAKVESQFLVALPPPISPLQSMAIGTAGLTAMLCVMALEQQGVVPGDGEVLVTGASGGVGSIAVALLSSLGYQVAAATGREQHSALLQRLGAARIVARSSLSGQQKPLLKEQWAGVVDVVGGEVLANACASTRYQGVVTACGLAGGMALPVTVAPFILRGVKLIGIDSVMCSRATRVEAWQRLAQALNPALLAEITSTIGLSEVIHSARDLLEHRLVGRVVVDVNR